MTCCHLVSCLGKHYWHLLGFALQMSGALFFVVDAVFFFFFSILNDILDAA